jgi:hypothetical protein
MNGMVAVEGWAEVSTRKNNCFGECWITSCI